MVGIMTLHMIQVFLFGAYKYPREMTWLSGCFLLFCTLGMAFNCQIMRFVQYAYWGLGIGGSSSGRVPFMGAQLVDFLLAGPIIGGQTLSRFYFTFHVFMDSGPVLLAFMMRCTSGVSPVEGHQCVPQGCASQSIIKATL